MSEAKDLSNKLDEIQRNAESNTVKASQFSNRTLENEFPAEYFERQQREQDFNTYNNWVADYAKGLNEKSGDKVNVNVTPREKDLEIYKQKEDELRLLRFEDWIQKNYLKETAAGEPPDLAAQKLIRDLVPEYYERRLKQIDRDIEIQRRAARIKLYGGPKTKDDMYFMYMLQSEQIKLPERLPYHTKTPEKEEYSRGLLNIKREAPRRSSEWTGNWSADGFNMDLPNFSLDGFSVQKGLRHDDLLGKKVPSDRAGLFR